MKEVGAGLDQFGQRSLFFGHSLKNFDSLNGKGDGRIKFLPFDLAKSFLDCFFSTSYNMMPVQPRSKLEEALKRIYAPPDGENLSPIEKAVLLAALANGASTTSWADYLYQEAKLEAQRLGEVVNIFAVQADLLLISYPFLAIHILHIKLTYLQANYQSSTGQPNSAYLHAGTAIRKAFAAGLHKELPLPSSTDPSAPSAGDHSEERRITIWCLYFYETYVD